MLSAKFMQTLSSAYLDDDDVLRRIFDAASHGDVGISFTLAELKPGVITKLRDADYTVEADTFHRGNLWVRWW